MSPINAAELVIAASTGLIAAVLLISGGAKLRAPAATLRAMTELGVPRFARHRWVAIALPVVELVVGLGLIVGSGAVRFAASLIALVMMLGFTVLVARALARGTAASCECFGALSRDELDGWTLGRNLVFVAAALAASFAGLDALSLLVEIATATAEQLAFLITIWAALAIIAVLLSWALRLRSRVRALEASPAATGRFAASAGDEQILPAVDASWGPVPMGSPIPAAELVNDSGLTLTLDRMARGKAVFLIFIKAGCGSCRSVADRFDDWVARIGDTVEFRVATSSRPDEMAEHYPEFGDRVRYGAAAVRLALGVDRVPSAVVLGNTGVVASPVAEGADEIEALVNGVAEARRQNAGG